MRFLGIYREQMFSPGRVDDDEAIMDATLAVLRNGGHDTEAISAEALDGSSPDVDCVLTMGQSDHVLRILEEAHDRGIKIVNPVGSIRLCKRAALMRLLRKAGLPLPPSEIIPVEEAGRRIVCRDSKHYWVKRGDVHKVEPGDVVKVTSQGEFEAALCHFRRSSISEILVQEHTDGDVVKFYGVSGGPAVRTTYFSAFPEGGNVEIKDNLIQLRSVAARAAATVGLKVYGGDAVVTRSGLVSLIDLNAWPSFSRCRSSAAQSIAGYAADISTCSSIENQRPA
jgi:hypothetical protein